MAKHHKITPEVRDLLEQAAKPLPTYPKLNKAKDGFTLIKYKYKGYQILAMGIKEAAGKPIQERAMYSMLGYDMQRPYRVLEQAFEKKGKAGLPNAIKSYMSDYKISVELLKAQPKLPYSKDAIAED